MKIQTCAPLAPPTSPASSVTSRVPGDPQVPLVGLQPESLCVRPPRAATAPAGGAGHLPRFSASKIPPLMSLRLLPAHPSSSIPAQQLHPLTFPACLTNCLISWMPRLTAPRKTLASQRQGATSVSFFYRQSLLDCLDGVCWCADLSTSVSLRAREKLELPLSLLANPRGRKVVSH